MPIRRIAILYNPRPAASDPSLPDDAFEEYDSADTVDAIASVIEAMNIHAVPVVADRMFPKRIEQGGFDIVFNIAEGEGRRCREAAPAAILEFLGVPFTGSDALTLGITLDKAIARRVVSPDVPVARGTLFREPSDFDALCFPIVVKPNDEGSSKGIRRNSVCTGRSDALERCHMLQERYGCPVLVEEYLPGAEVTVGIRGNAAPEVFGMMEIAPRLESDDAFLYSVEMKREWRRDICYYAPPRLSQDTLNEIRRHALAAYALLGCRDIARMDFRLDKAGVPRFIECNPLPGLNPESSDIVLMCGGRPAYPGIVQDIVRHAAIRYQLSAS